MQINDREADILLDSLTKNTIAFKPIYFKITKNIECAIILSQFRFFERMSDDGWINKTQHFIEQTTGISPGAQSKANKKLLEMGIFECGTYYGDFYPRVIYKINKIVLLNLIMEYEKKERDLDIFDDGSKLGNVYFMENKKNNYIKIGFTKNEPSYRERTLRSEDPDIKLMLHIKNATMQHEKMLHNFLKEKRVRGGMV